jgi:hypothetical protein
MDLTTTPRQNFSVMRTEWWNLLQRVFQGGDVATEVAVYNTNSNASPVTIPFGTIGAAASSSGGGEAVCPEKGAEP